MQIRWTKRSVSLTLCAFVVQQMHNRSKQVETGHERAVLAYLAPCDERHRVSVSAARHRHWLDRLTLVYRTRSTREVGGI